MVTLEAQGTVVIEQPSLATDASGHTLAAVRGNVPGDVVLRMKIAWGGIDLSPPARANLTLVPAATSLGNQVRVAVSPAVDSVDASISRAIRVQVVAASGAPIAHVPLTLTSSRSGDQLAPNTGVTDLDGQWLGTLVSTHAGEAIITASVPGGASAVGATQFLPGAPSQQHTYLLTELGTAVTADGVTVTDAEVFVGDQYGNAVSAAQVTVGAVQGTAIINPPAGVADGNGIFHTTVTTTQLGDTTVSVHTGTIASQHNVVGVVGPASAANSRLLIAPGQVLADGNQVAVASLALADAANHPLAAQPIRWQSSRLGDTLAPTTSVTDANGVTATQISSTLSGQAMVSGASPELSLQAPVGFLASIPVVADSTLRVTPTVVQANSTADAQLTAQLRDAHGNPTPAVSVSWAASDSAVQFGASSGQTDANGMITVSVAASHAGNVQLSAAFVSGSMAVSLQVQPSGVSASQSIFACAPTSAIADGVSSSACTLGVRDGYGNPIPGISVSFASGQGGAQLSQSGGTTDAQGQVQTTVSQIFAGAEPLTASFAGSSLASSVLFVAGAPAAGNSMISAAPATAVADGVSTVNISAHIADAYNNPRSGQSVYFGSSASSDVLSPNTGVTDANGNVQLALTGTWAGARTVSGQADNVTLSQPVTLTPGQPSATTSVLSITPNALVASDTNTALGTLIARDAYGNLVPGAAVAWTAMGNSITLGGPSTTTDGNGMAQITVTSTVAQLASVAASCGNIALSANLTILAGEPNATMSGLMATPNVVLADGLERISLMASFFDIYGNPTPNVATRWASTGQNMLLGATTTATDDHGQTGIAVSSTAVQNTTLSATASTAVMTVPLRFVVGAPNSTMSSIVVSPNGGVVANNSASATLTITIADSVGHPIGGQMVSLSSSGNNDQYSPASGPTNASGIFISSIVSTLAQTKWLTASAGSASISSTVTFIAGPPSSLVMPLSQATVADGNTPLNILGTVLDAYNNPVPQVAVNLNETVVRYVSVRTASAEGDNNFTLVTNNGQSFGPWKFHATVGGWSEWEESDLNQVIFQQGNNLFEMTQVGTPLSNWDAINVYSSHANWIIQGETATYAGGARTSNEDAGYTGTGTADFRGTYGATVSYNLFGQPGDLDRILRFRYGAGTGNFNYLMTLNGNALPMPGIIGTPAWSTWFISPPIPLTLQPGNNLLVFTNYNPGINIDYLQLSEIPVHQQVIQPELGTLFGGAIVNNDHAGYTGTGFIDLLNNGNAGVQVVIPQAGEVLSATALTTDANGNFSATLLSSLAETKTITASFAGLTFVQNVAFVPGPASSSLSQFAVGASSATAGAAVPVGVFVQDANQNPIANFAVTLTASTPSASFSSNTITTDFRGRGLSFVTTTASGPTSLCASFAGVFSACQNITIVPASPNASVSQLTQSPQNPVAGCSVTLTEQVLDAYSNPIAGQMANLVLLQNGLAYNTYAAPTNTSGIVSWTQTLTAAAAYSASGANTLSSLTTSFALTPNVPASVAVSGLRTGLPAGHINDFNVSMFDAYGNMVTNASEAGYTLQFTSSDTAAILPATYLWQSTDGGSHDFAGNIRLMTGGNQTVTAFVSGYPAAAGTLSAQVLQTVGSTYRAIITGSSPNQCLSPLNSRSVAGTPLSSSLCSGLYAQVMRIGADSTLRFLNQCVEAPSSASPVGQNVVLKPCNMNANQLWSFSGTQLASVGQAGYCLDANAAYASGAATLVSCGDANAQSFSLVPAPETIQWQIEGDLVNLQIFPGVGNTDTWWGPAGYDLAVYTPSGQLTIDGNVCIDFNNSTVQTGSPLVANNCSFAPSQQWTVDGPLMKSSANPNLCIDHTGGFNTQPTITACGSSSQQNWTLTSLAMFYQVKTSDAATPNYCLRTSGNPSGNSTMGIGPCAPDYNQIWTVSNYASFTQMQHSLFGENYAVVGNTALYGNVINVFAINGRANDDGYELKWYAEPSGSFVSITGASNNPTFSSSQAVVSGRPQVTTYSGASTQSFYTSVPTMSLSPVLSANMCLTAGSANAFINQSIVFEACAGAANQRFYYSRPAANTTNEWVMIRLGGMCVDIANGGVSGSSLLMAPCTGSTTQMWNVYNSSNNPLKSGAGTCLAGGSGIGAGVPATVAACSGSSSQNYGYVFY